MMSSNYKKAKDLADRRYFVRTAPAETTSGRQGFMAYLIDMPGCIAYGFTRDEALHALDGVKIDFIHSLLDSGLSVPEPTTQLSDNTTTVADDGIYTEADAASLELSART